MNSFIKKMILPLLFIILPLILVGCGGGGGGSFGSSSSGGGSTPIASLSKVVLSDIAPAAKPSVDVLNKDVLSTVQVSIGETRQFYAYAVYSDNTIKSLSATDFKWVYTPKGIFTPNGLTLVSTKSTADVGKSNVFAISYNSVVSNSVTVVLVASGTNSICLSNKVRTSVTDPCLSASDSIAISYGNPRQLYVYENFSNQSISDITNNSDVTWNLGSNPNLITVKNGLVASQQGQSGNTTIQVTYQSLSSAVVPVSVSKSSPMDICLSDRARTSATDPCLSESSSIAIPYGSSKQLYVYEDFSDNSILDITNDPNISWSLGANTNLVNVTKGLITDKGQLLGSTTIQATYQSLSSAVVPLSVTPVTNPTFVRLSNEARYSATDPYLSESSLITIPYKGSQQLYVYEDFGDQTTLDITDDQNTTWNLGSSGYVTVANGLVTSAGQSGSTTIQATYKSLSSDIVPLTVSKGTPVDICLSTARRTSATDPCLSSSDSISIPHGGSKQLYVYQDLSDKSTIDITNNLDVTWNLGSNPNNIISISGGLVHSSTGGNVGDSTTIQATYQSMQSGNITATIGKPVITGITVKSDQESAVVSLADNIYVTATYSDNSTESLASSDPNLSLSSNLADTTITNGVMTVANGATESSVIVTAKYNIGSGQPLTASIQIPIEQKQLFVSWNPEFNTLGALGGMVTNNLSLSYSKYFSSGPELFFGLYGNWIDKSHLTWINTTNINFVPSSTTLIPSSTDYSWLCYDYTTNPPGRSQLRQCKYLTINKSAVGVGSLSVTFNYIPDPSISKTVNLNITQ